MHCSGNSELRHLHYFTISHFQRGQVEILLLVIVVIKIELWRRGRFMAEKLEINEKSQIRLEKSVYNVVKQIAKLICTAAINLH